MRKIAHIAALSAAAMLTTTSRKTLDDIPDGEPVAERSKHQLGYHADYQRGVEEYVDWRKKSRLGVVSTFTSKAKLAVRAERKRALLDRQAAREKSGFYDGTMALANVLGQRFGRMRRQRGDNGGLVRLS